MKRGGTRILGWLGGRRPGARGRAGPEGGAGLCAEAERLVQGAEAPGLPAGAWRRPPRPPEVLPARAVGIGGTGAIGVGAVATAALAFGAMAIGALAIGALAVGRARVRRLDIGELAVTDLTVDRLQVRTLVVGQEERPARAEGATGR